MADEKNDAKPLTKLEVVAEMLSLQAHVKALDAALVSYNTSVRDLVMAAHKAAPPEPPDSAKWVDRGSYQDVLALNDKFAVEVSTLQKKLRKVEADLVFETAERGRLEILLNETLNKMKPKRSPTKK